MVAALHTILMMGCGDLKLNHLIYPTATARAMLDQRALMFLPGHTLDLPACIHTCWDHLQHTAHQHLYAARGG